MNDQDKQIVDVAKGAWPDDVMVQGLVRIIERLEEQLTGIKEAGEPIEDFIRKLPKEDDGYYITEIYLADGDAKGRLKWGDLRRLAEKLKEVKLEDERIKQHDTIMCYRDEVGFLKKQLTEIREVGQFIDGLVQLADKDDKPDDDYWLMDCGGGKLSEVEIGQIRRLAQALKEVSGD